MKIVKRLKLILKHFTAKLSTLGTCTLNIIVENVEEF